jgi:DNA-binding transcriptional LysR family regulator
MEAGQADLAVGPTPPVWDGLVREIGAEEFVLAAAPGTELPVGAGPSGATAHPVNELIPGNAVRLEDFRGEVQINGIGQNSQGLFGELGESCPGQHVNYVLPGRLHRACPTLAQLTVHFTPMSMWTAAGVGAHPHAWYVFAG